MAKKSQTKKKKSKSKKTRKKKITYEDITPWDKLAISVGAFSLVFLLLAGFEGTITSGIINIIFWTIGIASVLVYILIEIITLAKKKDIFHDKKIDSFNDFIRLNIIYVGISFIIGSTIAGYTGLAYMMKRMLWPIRRELIILFSILLAIAVVVGTFLSIKYFLYVKFIRGDKK